MPGWPIENGSLINSSVFKRDLKSQQQQKGTPLHPPSTPHPLWTKTHLSTFKWIDRALDTRPASVWQLKGSSAACQHWLTTVGHYCNVLASAACYLLMKTKYLPRREECLGLCMNHFVFRLFVMVGFINTGLHVAGAIHRVSWTPEQQICLPSAEVQLALEKLSIVLQCTALSKKKLCHH